ncbi:hypothetical protein AJ79_08416 [Helicocarpus griseus UAMH5409]|uniref:Large ribosomal subunit protein uL5m n=1 Tax=Helicocarpus griseus UAMH5409 TaxID=1447875 RepID=A0A2B7WT02_9EURO|nr:hypothetical protein AJ79_08416 [Helicocarpus griseus UAMH5409]
MALREPSVQLSRALPRALVPLSSTQTPLCRRNASSAILPETITDDLETSSTFSQPSSLLKNEIKSFDPVARSKARKTQLPPSRYQFRPPKYDRGPLHPHRPPPPSDPSSRQFIPGPFTLPRVEQTYESTISRDILTLCYVHNPPGFRPPPTPQRLRGWDDSSPYHVNRPLRGPRGGDVLRLLRKPITFHNIPKLHKITLHSYVNQVVEKGSAPLHVAGMAIQAISNVRVQTHKMRGNVAKWGIVAGKAHVSLTAELKGEDMYHFFGKLVDIVLPRIKDWRGVKGSSGDSSGNITFGLEPDMVAMFPEIEVNYDMYPPAMIPGCHITVHTTARTDKDARLLLNAMGIPFYGKYVN